MKVSSSWSPRQGKSMVDAALLAHGGEDNKLKEDPSPQTARYKAQNVALLRNFVQELKNDSLYSKQKVKEKQRKEGFPEANSTKSLYQKFVRWFLSKGANGGILPNGGVLILVALQIAGFIGMKKISVNVARRLDLPPGKRQPDAFSRSGRLIGWLIENGAVMTLCNLRSLLPHPEPIPDTEDKYNLKEAAWENFKVIVRNIAISTVSNLIAEQGAVYLLHLTSTRLYGNISYFTKQRRSASPMSIEAYLDWIKGNGILQIFAGGILLGLIESFLPKQIANEITDAPFSLLRFLKNFAVFRIVLDIAFYLGHKFLHKNKWAYENIHKRHHEHYTTNLRTNFHFSAPDLFIESAFPIFSGLLFLRTNLGVKLSRYEIHLMMTYAAWHESGTHLGKPLPVINIEKHAVEFHEVHHNRRDANFGITQWIDALAGTRILKKDTKGSL